MTPYWHNIIIIIFSPRISGVDVLKWSNSTLDTLNLKIMTPMPCEIVDKLSNESYTIKCEFIKHLDDTNKC